MNLEGIKELVFRAAESGDWSNVPEDVKLMHLENEDGECPCHVAAAHGLVYRVPAKLRLVGLFFENEAGIMALRCVQEADLSKFEWDSEKQSAQFAARCRVALIAQGFLRAFGSQCPSLN